MPTPGTAVAEPSTVVAATITPVPGGVRVWLASGHPGMRKGWASLALQVQERLGQDPHGGHLFLLEQGIALSSGPWEPAVSRRTAGRAVAVGFHPRPPWNGFGSVAFIIAAFVRRIVGWRASRATDAGFVLDARGGPRISAGRSANPGWFSSLVRLGGLLTLVMDRGLGARFCMR